jgi:hypothetical protein
MDKYICDYDKFIQSRVLVEERLEGLEGLEGLKMVGNMNKCDQGQMGESKWGQLCASS